MQCSAGSSDESLGALGTPVCGSLSTLRLHSSWCILTSTSYCLLAVEEALLAHLESTGAPREQQVPSLSGTQTTSSHSKHFSKLQCWVNYVVARLCCVDVGWSVPPWLGAAVSKIGSQRRVAIRAHCTCPALSRFCSLVSGSVDTLDHIGVSERCGYKAAARGRGYRNVDAHHEQPSCQRLSSAHNRARSQCSIWSHNVSM